MRPQRLGVIGLGAIGGSVAWQAGKAGVDAVIGYSLARADGVAAARAAAVTEIVGSAEEVVRRADLVVLAVPPQATVDLIRELADSIGQHRPLVTDVASVKMPIVEAARRFGLADRFAGSHPLCGTHASGFAGARHDLFAGARVFVTRVGEDSGAAKEVADFWSGVLDAAVVSIGAAAHDGAMAWTSHLPQTVASALAVAMARGTPPGAAFGTGARDTTRLAASGVEMWRDILVLNGGNVLKAVKVMEDVLAELRRAVEAGDGDAVAGWLDEGRRFRWSLEESGP